MADQKVKVRIEADDRASRDVDRVAGRFERLGNFVRRNLTRALVAGTAALIGFAAAIRSVVRASSEQEDAVRKLNAALAPLGDQAGAVSKALQEQAAALQSVTKYGDETIIAGQALLASFTKNEEEIKRATKAALDLSAATGQQLHSAFLLLARAATGETSMLSRYGVMLDESIPKSERFAAALAKINEQFGGQAQAQAQTFSGRMAQLGNAYGDLLERIGDAITANRDLSNSIQALTKWIAENKEDIAATAALWFEFASNIVKYVVAAFGELVAAGTKVIEFLDRLRGRIDLAEPSAAALDATARRLGISVSELQERLKIAVAETSHFNIATENAKSTTDVAKKTIEELKESVEGLADAYEKAVEGTKALGEVTSAQLEAQIIAINQELYNQSLILGESSAEYKRLVAVAAQKIATLMARIEALRSGQGDLKKSTIETGEAFGDYSKQIEETKIKTDALTESTNRGTAALLEQQEQIVRNTREFDALAASAGRAAAVEAALAGGATIGMGGTRVYLPGGGSRLVSGAGLGGNFFNPEKRSVVMPDGRIIFI